MPTQANSVPPSLVNELSELKRRMSAIERAPAPVAKFDRYPAIEWAAQDRPVVGGNIWSSVSIANVTGMTFDRLECKYITDWLITGKREAEVRLAAFRHYGSNQRECVSASGALRLKGNTARVVGVGTFRWIHGIPFGWDYADTTTVYTVELQHRYAVGPEAYDPNELQIFGMYKREKDRPASQGGPFAIRNGDNTDWNWVTYQAGTNRSPIGYITIPDRQTTSNTLNGSYSISAMHYCVGLPQDRIPEATVNGWAWFSGGASQWVRAPDITEPTFDV
ncbi:hypothetical protein ACIQXD_14335 [Streptomyces uncialis]|uniref:hypothetical protein n=1 Tax=Streptomyces uncialis TaxID=1048205 RepID=UPI00380F1733